MDILEELFYGRFDPVGEKLDGESKVKNLQSQVAQKEELLQKSLTDEQLRLMLDIDALIGKVIEESELESFKKGFQYSTQLLIAGLHPELNLDTAK